MVEPSASWHPACDDGVVQPASYPARRRGAIRGNPHDRVAETIKHGCRSHLAAAASVQHEALAHARIGLFGPGE